MSIEVFKEFDEDEFDKEEEEFSLGNSYIGEKQKIIEEDKEYHESLSEFPPETKPKSIFGDKYTEHPSISDQYLKYPDSTKPGAVEVAVFDLSDSVQLKDYNALLALEMPEEAPKIEIFDRPIKFSEAKGSFIALVYFRKIYYLQLLKNIR